jgi:hypothetical protein
LAPGKLDLAKDKERIDESYQAVCADPKPQRCSVVCPNETFCDKCNLDYFHQGHGLWIGDQYSESADHITDKRSMPVETRENHQNSHGANQAGQGNIGRHERCLELKNV